MAKKTSPKKSSAEQYKADRIKEIIIKCLIVISSIFVFGGLMIIPFVLFSFRKPTFDLAAGIIMIVSMSVSIIIIIAIYLIGNTFKTSNPKDYKILKYEQKYQ